MKKYLKHLILSVAIMLPAIVANSVTLSEPAVAIIDQELCCGCGECTNYNFFALQDVNGESKAFFHTSETGYTIKYTTNGEFSFNSIDTAIDACPNGAISWED